MAPLGMAVLELHLQYLAHLPITLEAEAEAEITAQAIQQVVLAATAVVVRAEILQLLAQQILVAVAVVVLTILPIIMVRLAVLVSLLFGTQIHTQMRLPQQVRRRFQTPVDTKSTSLTVAGLLRSKVKLWHILQN
jgi:hypothetical protein